MYYFYPDELLILPCTANYRDEFCLPGSDWLNRTRNCEVSVKNPEKFNETSGEPLLIHGATGGFHDQRLLRNLLRIPQFIQWVLFKNIHLLERSIKTRSVPQQQVFKTLFKSFLNYKIETDDLTTLKTELKQNFNAIPTNDLCYTDMKLIFNYI